MKHPNLTSGEGGCSCGRTRYRLNNTALIVHACHCRMCQRLTGGTNAVNILIEADAIELLRGETLEVLADTPSGAGQVITRCKTCYVAVWSVYRRFSSLTGVPVLFVRAGTLDRPEDFPPDVHIFAKTRQAHTAQADGKPSFAEFYPLQDVWSTRSLKRLSGAVPAPDPDLPPPSPERPIALQQDRVK